MVLDDATSKMSKKDLDLIHQIAVRASRLLKLSTLQVELDVVFVHANTPLRLEDLLKGERMDFAHDIYGIQKNLDRKTGELKNFFEPRFTNYPEKSDEQPD